MRYLLAFVSCLPQLGCAGHRSCCSTCGKIAAFVGLAALVGGAEGAIDSAIDPEPNSPLKFPSG